MRRIRVVVHTAEERGGGVLTDVLDDPMRAAGMLVDEGRDVVDEARDEDVRAGGGLLYVRLPRDYREIVAVRWPRECLLRLAQSLELHRQPALADFVVGEDLWEGEIQAIGRAKVMDGPSDVTPIRAFDIP
jgi:hypothetical protein